MILLVTGGLGFIGSNVCVSLLLNGFDLVVLDNLSNSKIEVIEKIELLSNNKSKIKFYEGDIRDFNILEEIFTSNNIYGVLHFAALKSVKESNEKKELYDDVNINGTINLVNIMMKHNCKKIIYSSSATVYGENNYPVNEDSSIGNKLSCVYAENKFNSEALLNGLYYADNTWNIIILRYFNPIGAHPSGILGEDPLGIPNNVFPYLLKTAKRIYKEFTLFGNDYLTPDGTCLRDYIHVDDLAAAHVVSLEKIINHSNNNSTIGNLSIYNVGTGKPTSVLELFNTMNKFLDADHKIKLKIGNKRDGDLPCTYANCDKINKELGWYPKYTIDDMCKHGLQFIGLLKLDN